MPPSALKGKSKFEILKKLLVENKKKKTNTSNY